MAEVVEKFGYSEFSVLDLVEELCECCNTVEGITVFGQSHYLNLNLL